MFGCIDAVKRRIELTQNSRSTRSAPYRTRSMVREPKKYKFNSY